MDKRILNNNMNILHENGYVFTALFLLLFIPVILLTARFWIPVCAVGFLVASVFSQKVRDLLK